MSQLELEFKTGDRQVDQAMADAIAALRALFPDRVRACYLTGSYLQGSAVENSDLDIFVVFKDALAPGPQQRAHAQLRETRQASPIGLDLKIFGESHLHRFGVPDLRTDTALLYGEDIRDRLPEIPPNVLATSYHMCFQSSQRLRGGPKLLPCPLDFPDPDDPFFGYCAKPMRLPNGERVPATRELIGCALTPALGRLSIELGRRFSSKSAAASLYRRHIGDAWSDFLDELYRQCRGQWRYRVPEPEPERAKLRELCRQALDFENHALGHFFEFLLAETAGDPEPGPWHTIDELAVISGAAPDEVAREVERRGLPRQTAWGDELALVPNIRRLVAVKRLGLIIFRDPRTRAALETLAGVDAPFLEPLRRRALAALDYKNSR